MKKKLEEAQSEYLSSSAKFDDHVAKKGKDQHRLAEVQPVSFFSESILGRDGTGSAERSNGEVQSRLHWKGARSVQQEREQVPSVPLLLLDRAAQLLCKGIRDVSKAGTNHEG